MRDIISKRFKRDLPKGPKLGGFVYLYIMIQQRCLSISFYLVFNYKSLTRIDLLRFRRTRQKPQLLRFAGLFRARFDRKANILG